LERRPNLENSKKFLNCELNPNKGGLIKKQTVKGNKKWKELNHILSGKVSYYSRMSEMYQAIRAKIKNEAKTMQTLVILLDIIL